MAKKNFDQGLEKLFSAPNRAEEVANEQETMTEVQELEPERPKRGRPAAPVKSISFCTMADEDKVDKIRTISSREGIPIKDLVNLAFSRLINEYESKYGTIRVQKNKKVGDINKVFDI